MLYSVRITQRNRRNGLIFKILKNSLLGHSYWSEINVFLFLLLSEWQIYVTSPWNQWLAFTTVDSVVSHTHFILRCLRVRMGTWEYGWLILFNVNLLEDYSVKDDSSVFHFYPCLGAQPRRDWLWKERLLPALVAQEIANFPTQLAFPLLPATEDCSISILWCNCQHGAIRKDLSNEEKNIFHGFLKKTCQVFTVPHDAFWHVRCP